MVKLSTLLPFQKEEVKTQINESALDTVMSNYRQQMFKKMPRKIGKWTLSAGGFSGSVGTWEWTNPVVKDSEGLYIVYATPFYEGVLTLPIQVSDGGGSVWGQDSKDISFVPTMDLDKDVKTYVKLMKPFLRDIEARYGIAIR